MLNLLYFLLKAMIQMHACSWLCQHALVTEMIRMLKSFEEALTQLQNRIE
jgi:hypothetical protein